MSKSITSNQFYGAINRRFDHRVSLLHRFGFQFLTLSGSGESSGAAVRVLARWAAPWSKPDLVAVSFVQFACNRAWRDELARLLQRDHSLQSVFGR